MKKIILCTVPLAVSLSVNAQYAHLSKLSPQSRVELKATPSSRAESVVSAYLNVDKEAFNINALDAMGVSVALDLGDILTLRAPITALEDLANLKGVKYIQVATPVHQMLDIAKAETGVSQVHQGATVSQPYTGKGVVIGIVDKGFDYNHAAFRDAEGNLRIKRVWEQTSTPGSGEYAPEKFGYGTEFRSPEAITAAAGDVNNNSHGTHVTSIAAGSDQYNNGALCGVAPSTDIVLVSMTDGGENNVDISNAIAYIFDYADEVDMPCVINLSLGAHNGPHDGTSTFDMIADRLQGPGRLIVGSAGNHRAGSFHIAKDFTDANADALRTFIKYPANISKNVNGNIEIWADKGTEIEVALIAYKLWSHEVVERIVIDQSADDTQEINLGRNISGQFTAVTEISPLNDKLHILLASAITSIRNGYEIAIEVTPKSTGSVNIWADNINLGLTSNDEDGFSSPSNESTICEIGGTANRILTVGAYTTRNKYTLAGESTERTLEETIGDISSFSSCGPTADGRIKPQIAAPGCLINAAASSFDNSSTLLKSTSHSDGMRNHQYAYMQGTSMSSPFVAGTVATWLEAWPELTPETLVDVVKLTARNDEYTVNPNDWGYGKIDALSGLRECIARANAGITDIINPASAPVAIAGIDADGISLLFKTDLSNVNATLYSTMGAMITSLELGSVSAADILKIPLHSLHGTYILSVSTPSSTHALKVTL